MKFIAIRYGSNAANQSMCNRAVIGVIVAESEDRAREVAEAEWTFYNNQYLSLIRPAGASYADKRDASECEVISAADREAEYDAMLA
jgi:hypothetical protein